MSIKFLLICFGVLTTTYVLTGCTDSNIDQEISSTPGGPSAPGPSTPGGGSLTISDGPFYDYGSTSVGNTMDHVFTVTNAGVDIATAINGTGLVMPFDFTGGTYPGTGGTCAASLASGASCTMVVRFAPGIVGVAADTIVLDYNDGSSAQSATRDVSGTGAP